jgi:phospholipid/cholesterol/gamma-HCH transport system permease protein
MAAEPVEAAAPRWQWLRTPVERLGSGVIDFFTEVGHVSLLGFQVVTWALRPPYRLSLLLAQCEFVGVGSLFIVLLTGVFTGLVFALQSSFAFAKFNAESLVGATVVISLCRELAPVLTGLMVTGRAGSAMATELGTMRVTEQIDALETFAINPIQFLAVPRVLALVITMPMLTMLFNYVGFLGAYVISVFQAGINEGTFMGRIHRLVEITDLLGGLGKSAVFGLVIGLIACHKGMNAAGGSRGVGLAATSTVVTSSVAILITDYFMTSVLLVVFDV